MQITERTQWSEVADVAEYFGAEDKKALKVAALKRYAGVGSGMELPLRVLLQALSGSSEYIPADGTALSVYYVQAVGDMITEVEQVLERMKLEPTEVERYCSNGTIPMTAAESVVVFVRRYFGLSSFAACEQVSVGEYLIARHDDYNMQVAQRNFGTWQKKKMRKK